VANAFELTQRVAAPADEVWAVVADSSRLPDWFAPVQAVREEGERRVLTMQGGALMTERILGRDDTARRYEYSVVEGARTPMISHRAGFEVLDLGEDASEVRWWTDARPADPEVDMERRLRPVMAEGLEALRTLLERR
jgi:carbon monoxide dehydrogenase subunit G